MSIENSTLAHFRHFSSLFTLSPLYICRELSTNQLLFMQNKPNFQKAKMNITPYNIWDYENKWQRTLSENKPKQTQLQIQRLSKLFLAFTFLCPSYNLAMQTWTIQKLLNWVTEHLTGKGIDSPRLSAELLLSGVLLMKRIELYTQFDRPVAKQQLDRLHD